MALNFWSKLNDHVPLVRQTNGLTNFNEYCHIKVKYDLITLQKLVS